MPCVRVRKQMKVGWPSKGGKPEKGNKIDRNIGTNVRGLAANFALFCGFWGCLCAAGPVRENDTYCKRSIRVVSMFRCAGAKCPEGAGGGGGRDRRLVVPAGRCNVRFHLVRDFFADFPALDSHFLQQ